MNQFVLNQVSLFTSLLNIREKLFFGGCIFFFTRLKVDNYYYLNEISALMWICNYIIIFLDANFRVTEPCGREMYMPMNRQTFKYLSIAWNIHNS